MAMAEKCSVFAIMYRLGVARASRKIGGRRHAAGVVKSNIEAGIWLNEGGLVPLQQRRLDLSVHRGHVFGDGVAEVECTEGASIDAQLQLVCSSTVWALYGNCLFRPTGVSLSVVSKISPFV